MRNPAVRWLPLGIILAAALIIPSGCYVYPVGGVVRTETVVREAPAPPMAPAMVEAPPVYDAPPVVEAPIVENEIIYIDEYHHRPPHTYIYYPGDEVYYDPISVSFFWSEGGHWRSGRHLPGHIRLHEDHRVTFRSDAPHPYDVHTRISSRYHASSQRDADRHVDSRRPSAPAPTRSSAPALTPGAPSRATAPGRVPAPSLRTPARVTSPAPAVSPAVRAQTAPARISDSTVRAQVTPVRTPVPTVRAQAAPARVTAAPPRAAAVPARRSEDHKKAEDHVNAQ